jgi:hypothetical protein
MIRYAAALSVLALAACAQPQPVDPRAPEAAQVYQNLQLQNVEQQMIDDDKQLTYGLAAVNCGLRSQQWMNMLQAVYQSDYKVELQRHPLTAEQQAEAKAYAEAHISNPSPPPYICELLANDEALPQIDYNVGLESLIIASTQKKAS